MVAPPVPGSEPVPEAAKLASEAPIAAPPAAERSRFATWALGTAVVAALLILALLWSFGAFSEKVPVPDLRGMSEAQAQAALAESENKLTAALESAAALQNQLNAKESAFNGAQAQINELAARTVSLSDEKLGLTSQLQALQADHTTLLAMKASFEEQSAALVKAEGKVKDLAALQAKDRKSVV